MFAPGKLEASSWDAAGRLLATTAVATSGPAARLKLTLDTAGMGGVRVSGPCNTPLGLCELPTGVLVC